MARGAFCTRLNGRASNRWRRAATPPGVDLVDVRTLPGSQHWETPSSACGAIPGIGGLLGAIPTGKKMPGGGAAAGGTPNSDMLSSLLGAPQQRPGDPEFDRNMDGASSAAVLSRAVNNRNSEPPPDPALAIGEPSYAKDETRRQRLHQYERPSSRCSTNLIKKTVQAGYAPGGNTFDAKQYAPAKQPRNGGGADQQGGVDNSIMVNATGMDESSSLKGSRTFRRTALETRARWDDDRIHRHRFRCCNRTRSKPPPGNGLTARATTHPGRATPAITATYMRGRRNGDRDPSHEFTDDGPVEIVEHLPVEFTSFTKE